jgi:predicted Ser/Thr protein kinase
MPQILTCPNPNCKKPVQVPDGSGGKQLKCPLCQKMFIVPASGPAAAVKVAAASHHGAPVGAAKGSSAGASSAEFQLPNIPSSGGGGNKCPSCGAGMLPSAICCMECGWTQPSEEDTAGDAGNVIICNNPACGVANPPTERNCVRCNNVLPTPPGTMIKARYRIEKQLAVGGFGAVYLATDTKTSNKVAIKDMICGDAGEFSIRLNFFRREMEILKALEKCPIVPRIYELIEDGDKAHLIMEFIKGKDLLKIMGEDPATAKPYTVEQIVEWAKSICDVLTVMHTQNPPLVHRDLKPDNVMLLEDGKTIKMIDFGTARDIGRTARDREKAKTRVYTEGYAPPEQIIGKPEPRSDLFALAGTLFHLVTGKSPEGSFTAKEIEQKLAGQNGGVQPQHKWFWELMRINLAEDVNDRYFTAKDFKADLEKKGLTKDVTCKKCKAATPFRTPFCSKCATPLTDATVACNQCGKNNFLGCKYCIYCGGRLR